MIFRVPGGPIMSYADVSTSHLSEADILLLSSDEGKEAALVISEYKEGFFIAKQDKCDIELNMKQAGYSDYAIMLFVLVFEEMEVDIMRLDCDGYVLRDVPIFYRNRR